MDWVTPGKPFGYLQQGKHEAIQNLEVPDEAYFDGRIADAAVKRIAGLVSEAQRRGELDRSVDAMDAAQQLFSTHYFGLVTWLGGTIPSRAVQEAQFRASLGLLLRGLGRSAA